MHMYINDMYAYVHIHMPIHFCIHKYIYINNGQNRLVCRYISMCFCVCFYIDINT